MRNIFKRKPKIDPERAKEQQELARILRVSTGNRLLQIDNILHDAIKGQHLKKSQLISLLRTEFLTFLAKNFVSINDYQQTLVTKNELLTVVMVLASKNRNSIKISMKDLVGFKTGDFSVKYHKGKSNEDFTITLEKIKKK